ncbi:MAG: GDSL-type esterase/lipase family protein [Kiritimatiellae bacterium]|nr:GDSL-type esterase/lipase family protein [Kiritimatiellia bacterium]
MSRRPWWLAIALAGAAVAAEPLPRVLIIGDSISIGYTPHVRVLLQGRAEVFHNPGNAMHTRHGLAQLDAWLGTDRWDVIHFNFGLHDLKHVTAEGSNALAKGQGTRQVDLPEYRRNIEAIGRRLLCCGARVIFATTTPYPEGTSPYRDPADCALYNDAALCVLRPLGIAVNDLARLALPNLGRWQRPRNVHFNEEGSRALGEAVAQEIWRALGGRPDDITSFR